MREEHAAKAAHLAKQAEYKVYEDNVDSGAALARVALVYAVLATLTNQPEEER